MINYRHTYGEVWNVDGKMIIEAMSIWVYIRVAQLKRLFIIRSKPLVKGSEGEEGYRWDKQTL
jgi:hypothetical protein